MRLISCPGCQDWPVRRRGYKEKTIPNCSRSHHACREDGTFALVQQRRSCTSSRCPRHIHGHQGHTHAVRTHMCQVRCVMITYSYRECDIGAACMGSISSMSSAEGIASVAAPCQRGLSSGAHDSAMGSECRRTGGLAACSCCLHECGTEGKQLGGGAHIALALSCARDSGVMAYACILPCRSLHLAMRWRRRVVIHSCIHTYLAMRRRRRVVGRWRRCCSEAPVYVCMHMAAVLQ